MALYLSFIPKQNFNLFPEIVLHAAIFAAPAIAAIPAIIPAVAAVPAIATVYRNRYDYTSEVPPGYLVRQQDW